MDQSSVVSRRLTTGEVILLPVRTGKVTSQVASRLPRQDVRQTRADLIEAAARLVNEHVQHGPRPGDPPVDLLPFVDVDDVLQGATEIARQRLIDEGRLDQHERVAPLTQGAFYKAFADAHDRSGAKGGVLTTFHREVTRHMIRGPLLTGLDRYQQIATGVFERGEHWSEIVRIGISEDFERQVMTPALVLLNALAFHAAEEEVRSWVHEIVRAELAELTPIYSTLLPVVGRRMKAGVTEVHLAAAIADLISGIAIGSRFDRASRDITIRFDATGTGEPQDWHLAALAAWAICESLSEPAEVTRPAKPKRTKRTP
jgi:hypothetical protein